jgi:hypothetical protein
MLKRVRDKILEHPKLLEGSNTWGPTCVISSCNRLGYHDEELFKLVVNHFWGMLEQVKSHEVVLVVRALEESRQQWAVQCIEQDQVGLGFKVFRARV